MNLAIIGGGWAGVAAALEATRAGHRVTLWEASRNLGGRARALPATLPSGEPVQLDNGQHILIGAYHACLRLMQMVGIDPGQALLRLPMTLRFADGSGIALPRWPAPLDAAGGILAARGWSWRDRVTLLGQTLRWRLAGFRCAPELSVAALCQHLTPRVMADLIEPLCVAALNTPACESSATVFLRVLQDSVFGPSGSSHLLLPTRDLSRLFPAAAARWLERHGVQLRTGRRVQQISPADHGWRVEDECFDQVIVATAATDAIRLLEPALAGLPPQARAGASRWLACTRQLQHRPIATVYAWGDGATLQAPMLALRDERSAQRQWPAQFVFDRRQLGGPPGLLAFVVSASAGAREELQQQVLQQAQEQLGLALQPVQTVVEKRATIACTPGLHRPGRQILAGLHACADYVDGPYPSTLEGAVRNAVATVAALD